jgi:hypothetical protein
MELRDHERSDSPSPTGDRPRCAACQDVIGVYGPLVHVLAGLAWRTSRAAEPDIATAAGMLFHLSCYELLGAETEAPRPG